MEKFCSFFCSVDKYGPLILLSVQYMVEPFCLTNFSATSHSTHPVPAVPSQAGRKSEPFLSFFISIWGQQREIQNHASLLVQLNTVFKEISVIGVTRPYFPHTFR